MRRKGKAKKKVMGKQSEETKERGKKGKKRRERMKGKQNK